MFSYFFLLVDFIIIKDNLKTQILSIKTFI